MGSSNSGGGSSSGGGGGGRSSSTKKDNGTSRYFKKTSTKKRRATPKGGKSMASQKAITKSNNDRSSAQVSAAPAAKVTKVEKNPSFGVLKSDKQAKKTLPDVSTTVTRALKPTLKKATPKVSITPTEQKKVSAKKSATSIAPKAKPKGGQSHQATNVDGLKDPGRNKLLLQKYQEQSDKPPAGLDMNKYNEVAGSQKGSKINAVSPLMGKVIGDKYRNDDVSYNQAYWAAQKASGVSQADMAAEQKSIGMSKAYSGDKVVTNDDVRRGKYTLAALENAGIKPTTTTEKKGLLGETTLTKNSYDIGTGKPLTTTESLTSPTIGGFRLGKDKSTTYVDGVATWKGEGKGEDMTYSTPERSAIGDQASIKPATQDDLKDIDSQIANEKDPEILKELHRRRLALMRSMRTQTRYSSLLSDADVKRANLMGIL